MTHGVESRKISGQTMNVAIDRYPDECPICHTSVYPLFLEVTTYLDRPRRVQSVFRCTKQDCGQLFIGTYSHTESKSFTLKKVEPLYPHPQTFPPQIQDISPMFVEVYSQAIAAEAASLFQLTGIGLRKALEFLVKDFAISQKPKQEDEMSLIRQRQ